MEGLLKHATPSVMLKVKGLEKYPFYLLFERDRLRFSILSPSFFGGAFL